jgi:(1->4)-alpha-D-glucan 1-alpha-D-glucosylmutase
VLDWLDRGILDGVRVDHPDGLRDPLEYMERLRKRAPDAWIVGEKILEPGEFLR